MSRERILAAALELADEQGIDALSMRKLGQSVGYEAMSLYNHVANKDDLLDGMLDLVLAEMQPPAQDGGFAGDPGGSPLGARGTEAAPMGRRASDGTRASAAGQARVHGRVARCVAQRRVLGGDDVPRLPRHRRAHHWVLALGVDARLRCPRRSATTSAHSSTGSSRSRPIPYLHEHGLQHLEDGPHKDVSAFEFALDLLLESLERLRGSQR